MIKCHLSKASLCSPGGFGDVVLWTFPWPHPRALACLSASGCGPYFSEIEVPTVYQLNLRTWRNLFPLSWHSLQEWRHAFCLQDSIHSRLQLPVCCLLTLPSISCFTLGQQWHTLGQNPPHPNHTQCQVIHPSPLFSLPSEQALSPCPSLWMLPTLNLYVTSFLLSLRCVYSSLGSRVHPILSKFPARYTLGTPTTTSRPPSPPSLLDSLHGTYLQDKMALSSGQTCTRNILDGKREVHCIPRAWSKPTQSCLPLKTIVVHNAPARLCCCKVSWCPLSN